MSDLHKSKMTGGQYLSLGVGLIAASAAIYVLTQDYWAGGDFSPLHVLLPIIAIVAIASGKLLYCALHDGVWSNAAGFALLFVLATCCVLMKSVGKQAEVYDVKTSVYRHANQQHLAISGRHRTGRKSARACPSKCRMGNRRPSQNTRRA